MQSLVSVCSDKEQNNIKPRFYAGFFVFFETKAVIYLQISGESFNIKRIVFFFQSLYK